MDIGSLSIIIPTHNRERYINNLFNSIKTTYPEIPIIIIDTSNRQNNELINSNYWWLKYIHLKTNNWISYSRNYWLRNVGTNYVLFMDDDFSLSPKTNLAWFVQKIKNENYDILWGEVSNIWWENYEYQWIYNISNNTLFHFIWLKNDKWVDTYDIIFNYFIAQTSKINEIWGWDENLRFAREHDDFFLTCKKNNFIISYDSNFWINHICNTKKYYENYEIFEKNSSINYFRMKYSINSKIEIRYIRKNWSAPYLSIYRFMWNQYLQLKIEDIKLIYKKMWLDRNAVPYKYKHIL